MGAWYFKKTKNLFAFGRSIFVLKSNSVMHLWFLCADVMFLTETVIAANIYLIASSICLLCPFQKLRSSLNDAAMSWSAASASIRHDLSGRFRAYISVWDLTCNYPSH